MGEIVNGVAGGGRQGIYARYYIENMLLCESKEALCFV